MPAPFHAGMVRPGAVEAATSGCGAARHGRSQQHRPLLVRQRVKGLRRWTWMARLVMPLGEAIFTQRSIRRFQPDPVPIEDIRLILEAAAKAPSGGNRQPACFLVLTDRDVIRQFGALYREAWCTLSQDMGSICWSLCWPTPATFRAA